ncbi:hypothetical protein VSDG_04840 [Cytospora chrysosperma]|uniref:HCP-like protein n=1 Tax=Cytospora chrysosperma TaxID=252740 RepID=A0A423W3H8_CYTCH|nr:hypothetical protein VSDG_04840 [Valsa sordida]
MGLRDILKKKDKIEDSDENRREDAVDSLQAPQFTFIRSDTNTQEIIHPPSDPSSLHESHEDVNYLSASDAQQSEGGGGGGASQPRRLSDAFWSRSRGSSASSRNSSIPEKHSPVRRISQRLQFRRGPASSEHVPQDLPEIVVPTDEREGDQTAAELQWEKRATMLAKAANENELHRSRPPTPPTDTIQGAMAGMRIVSDGRPEPGIASSPAIDADIQEAIRLHEEGDLRESTRLFGILAEPKGANNPLSQVLYGLALRHGWGCEPDPEKAVFYLSSAAKNAADVESLALQAGLKKGGAAKGELVLAIFELANCFRHGWGIEKDPIAAKQYYETAANLGDTDAMNEVAWCYLEGFGCKKDKYSSAKYYRLAEKNGNKTLGNTWIWKDKYNPENGKHGKHGKK